jgi:hypothetical protein
MSEWLAWASYTRPNNVSNRDVMLGVISGLLRSTVVYLLISFPTKPEVSFNITIQLVVLLGLTSKRGHS